MSNITVSIPPSLRRKMDRLAGDEWVKAPLDEVLDLILEKARRYPPERAGQRYVRTFKLQASWRKEELSSTSGQVSSVGVAYNRYVMAAADQAWMHRGRWQTDESIAGEAAKEALPIFSRYINGLLNE